MIKFYTIPHKGKWAANIGLLKYCLATNSKLDIISERPKETLQELQQLFPDKLMTITGNVIRIVEKRK